jgi:hypothetical protein
MDLKAQILERLDLESFYRQELPGLTNGRGDQALALCPFHEDTAPSLSINLKSGVFYCHGCGVKGDVFNFYQKRHGCDFKGALAGLAQFAGVEEPPQSRGKIVATYDYLDSNGKLVFQVCRIEPGKNGKKKDFSQRRPDGKGGFIWKMTGVKLILYRLPEVLKAKTVFVMEGEKDADNLAALGLAATTNAGGAGKWRKDYNPHFQGKDVVILPDNDDPGRAHAQDVARNLHGVAAGVKVVELPGLPGKDDVSDWFEAGGTVEQLKTLVEMAPEWQPQVRPQNPKIQTRKPEFPTIQFVTGRELQSIEFKEPAWIVQGILPEGLCLLSARPKKGKTWLALNISVAKASGGCALSDPELHIDQGKTLYLCLEDKLRRAQKRLTKIMGEGIQFPEDLILAESWPRLDKGGLEALQDFLKEHDDCKMVVVDSYVKIKPPRSKNVDPYDHDMQIGGALQALAQERRICLLLIYHNRKTESEDPLDDIIGSTGLSGAVDAALVLRRGRGQADGTLFITGRDVEEQELALKFHASDGLWELLGDAAEYAKSRERLNILARLREQGPQTPQEIAKSLSKKQVNIKALLWKMVKDGEVKSVDGKYEIIKK